MHDAVDPDLLQHLVATTGLSPGTCRRVVQDIVAHYAEPVEAFVIRRHGELKRDEGLKNEEIFARLVAEASARRFAAPPLTERQVRRMIYG